MRLAPRGKRGGPFLRTPQVEQLVTRAEYAAVDDPGDERADFAARDADHHFVEHREAVGGLVREQQHASLPVTCEREQVAVLESCANLRGLTEGGCGGGNV